MKVLVREGSARDRDFVIDTARRFAAFGPPPWRSPAELVGGEVRCLDEFFDGGLPGCALLVAEDESGRGLGFTFLEPHVDYFSGETHGHLGMIAVTDAAEGAGAGGALLRAAEGWARERGYTTLTLNVFEGNTRARAVYEHFGYEVETLRYLKRLD
jgi:GNAT superfamily N-acetyltransferase